MVLLTRTVLLWLWLCHTVVDCLIGLDTAVVVVVVTVEPHDTDGL